MIRAFWQSKLAAGAAVALSLGVIAFIWMRNAGRPVYIPILATVLMLGIGFAVARLLGNLTASSQNVKCLGLLHMELDPEAFIKAYEKVPEKLPEKSLDRAVTFAYLSDGYAAAGEFDKAIEALYLPEESGGKKQSAAMRGTYWQKLCSCQLLKGDVQAAKKSLQSLDEVISENSGAKESLIENLKVSRRLLQNRIAAQTNKQVEKGWLEEQLKKAPYKLLRLEILQAQANTYIRDGEKDNALRALDAMISDGGRTFYTDWAKTRKKELAL